MINLKKLKRYQKYDLRYDPLDKILFVYKKMLVKDFIAMKNIISYYELEVKDIRILEKR